VWDECRRAARLRAKRETLLDKKKNKSIKGTKKGAKKTSGKKARHFVTLESGGKGVRRNPEAKKMAIAVARQEKPPLP